VKVLRFVAAASLIAGGALTCRAGYQQAKAALAETLIRRVWSSGLRTGKAKAPWPKADLRPVARLQIPRLGYDEIVLEGATPRTLAFGPARLFSSAGLGEPGNLELAGHRTSWFLPLEAVQEGDRIEVQWFDARKHALRERTYTVDAIRIVAPEDVPSLAPASTDALTLITCYPFGHSPRSPQRFVVLASPAGPSRLARIPGSAFRVS